MIVNITSVEANLRPVDPQRENQTGLPQNGPAYGASKAALNRMANVIAQEGLEHRIAVVTVEPGFVLTETMAATFTQTGVTDTDAIPTDRARSAIAYLCTCDDPMRYTGEIVAVLRWSKTSGSARAWPALERRGSPGSN